MAVRQAELAKPPSRIDKVAILLSLPALIAVLVLFVFPFLFGLDFSAAVRPLSDSRGTTPIRRMPPAQEPQYTTYP